MKIKGLKKIRKTEALGMFFIMVGSALNFPVAIWAENIESPEACVVTTERENEPEASDNVMKSGICGVAGDNVRWTLDDKGILTISGSGDALDYASVSDAPWALNDETVECPIISIVIDTGVTNVGAYSFSGHSCTDVRIADSVIKIGSNIFETWDSIQTIYYHGTQKQWEDSVQVGENNTGWIEKLTFHTHTADSAWESDKTHHWHNCIDPDCPTTDIQWKDSYGQHKWEAGGCLDCGFQCEHDEGNEEWIKTAVSHEKRWNCCGAVIVAEEVHEWNSGICEECGYVCEHTGGLASCTEQAICQTCGEAYGELASHDWEDDFTIDQPATCTEDGVKSIHCKNCTATKDSEVIQALDHNLEKIEKEEATCTEGGYEGYWSCTNCQKLFADEGGTTEILSPVEIPAYGHALEKAEKKEATCTEGGYESYWKCKTCQKLFADEGGTTEIISPVEISAQGHALEKTEKKEGTCVKPGYESYWKCKTCQKLFADEGGTTEISGAIEIPSQGHVLEKTERKEATCTERGYESYWKCKTCQKLFADEGGTKEISSPVEISAQGHALEKTEKKEATCVEPGYEEYYTCRVCGKLYQDKEGINEIGSLDTIKISAEGHKGGENWLLNADKHWKECAVCQKRIEEADHIYENEKDSACKICGYKRAIKSEPPRIIDGYNEKWQVNSGKTLSFCSSAPFSEFINVTIDNEVVNENNYDKKEGSTIITLHSEFLSALSVGVHTLSINSESGSATTGFVIEKAPLEPSPTVEPSPTDAPSIVAASSVVTATPTPTTAPEETNTKTGDESKIIIWILVLFLSAEGILIILQKFKKKTR